MCASVTSEPAQGEKYYFNFALPLCPIGKVGFKLGHYLRTRTT